MMNVGDQCGEDNDDGKKMSLVFGLKDDGDVEGDRVIVTERTIFAIEFVPQCKHMNRDNEDCVGLLNN